MEQVIKKQTDSEKKQSELELAEDPILNGCCPIKTWEEDDDYDEEKEPTEEELKAIEEDLQQVESGEHTLSEDSHYEEE